MPTGPPGLLQGQAGQQEVTVAAKTHALPGPQSKSEAHELGTQTDGLTTAHTSPVPSCRTGQGPADGTQVPPAQDPHPVSQPLHPGRVGVVVVVVVLVVVVVAQPDAVHASQQLANCPTHALPPFGLAQGVVLLLIEHLVTPFAAVRQQLTKPGFPQVERAAHLFTNRRQLLFARTALAC